MIMPGNSRDCIKDSLADFTEAPYAATIAAINSLDKNGFRVVQLDECTDIIKRLAALANSLLPDAEKGIHPDILLAEAFTSILNDQ